MGWADAIRAAMPAVGALAVVVTTIVSMRVRFSRKPVVRPGISESSQRLIETGRNKLLSRLANTGAFFGVDIGGTLVKLMFFEPDAEVVDRVMSHTPVGTQADFADRMGGVRALAAFLLARTQYGGTGVRDDELAFHLSELGGTFHFIRFETRRLTGALKLARRHGLHSDMATVCATGGGALRYRPLVASLLGGVDLVPADEIDCLVKGMGFLMSHVPAEAYTFHGRRLVDVGSPGAPERGFHDDDETAPCGPGYPYLLVNVGSGVGFILVTSEHEWRRVSGTSIGGGTYYGLTHMLSGVGSFDEMLDLAEEGNNANVDLTVGDIYGGDYSAFGLKATTIASSFGKAVTWNGAGPGGGSGGGERERGSSSDGLGGVHTGASWAGSAPSSGSSSSSSSSGVSDGSGAHAVSGESAAGSRRPVGAVSRVLEEGGAYSGEVIGGPGPRRSESVKLQHEPAPSSPPPVGAASRLHDAQFESRRDGPVAAGRETSSAPASPISGGGGSASSSHARWYSPGSVAARTRGDSFSGSSSGYIASDGPAHAGTTGGHESAAASSGAAGGGIALDGPSGRPPRTPASPARPADDRPHVTSSSPQLQGRPPGKPAAMDAASVIGLSAQGSGAWGERTYEARDIARSMLIMISNNIGQLAYLNALKFKCK